MKPEPLFYIPVEHNEHEVAGPYDLVQMARLLRTKIISAETLTHREGEADWKPFGDRPQFIIAVEMPPDAVSNRLEMLKALEEAKAPPIPLPSAATMLKLGALALLLLTGGAIAYFVARADTTTGVCIAVGAGGVSLLGQAMIFVRLMDEDWITRLMVVFIPFFDIYYFLANLDKYLAYFCAKYIGAILGVAAYLGISSVDLEQADELKSILNLFHL